SAITPPYPDRGLGSFGAAFSGALFRDRAGSCDRGNGGARLCAALCKTAIQSRKSDPCRRTFRRVLLTWLLSWGQTPFPEFRRRAREIDDTCLGLLGDRSGR